MKLHQFAQLEGYPTIKMPVSLARALYYTWSLYNWLGDIHFTKVYEANDIQGL